MTIEHLIVGIVCLVVGYLVRAWQTKAPAGN